MMSDPIREYMKERGCSLHIIDGGLDGLVNMWEGFVNEVSAGYSFGLDDYLNDLDRRQILEDVLASYPELIRPEIRRRIKTADEKFIATTEPRAECLWGGMVANDMNWTPEKNWWFYKIPLKASQLFRHELNVQ